MADDPRPAALVMGIANWLTLPPPWFVPAEAPACGAVLDVPAEATNDGLARRFVCDRIAGHEDRDDQPPGDGPGDRHRQVTDNDEGRCFTWPVGVTVAPCE